MKKVVIVIILLLAIGILVYSNISLNYTKSKNNNIKDDINSLNNDIKKAKENGNDIESKIDTLKENSKEKLEELSIWEKAVEKLEKVK